MQLGIDTSGAVSIAVAEDPTGPGAAPRILAVESDDRARHHDEVLLGLIDRCVREAGATRADLARIVVGRGPGPFTGLRVGLVVARTLGAVLGAEVEGLCSLDALAHEAAQAEPHARTIAVALDARRREVYWALYRVERAADGSVQALVRESGPAVDAPADVAPQLMAADARVGSGCALYADSIPATADAIHVDAGHLLTAAALVRAAEGPSTPASTEPLYLREPDAAKPTARKSALGL